MKKFAAMIFAFAFLSVFTACNTNSNSQQNVIDSSSHVDSSSPSSSRVEDSSASSSNLIINKIDENSSGDSVSHSETSDTKCETINFGEQISLDFVEFTINGASSDEEIRPDNPESVYRYMSDQEGEKYIYLYGDIKNVSGERYEFADNMYAQMIFDDKYKYSASVTADEGGNFSYIYAPLDPLKSEKFYITASVPDEMAEKYAQVEVIFGFAKNFDGEYNIQENECDYLYSITVSK